MIMTELYNLGYCPLCKRPVTAFDILQLAAPRQDWLVHCVSGAYCHATTNDGRERLIYMALVAQPAAKQERLL